MIVFSYLFCFVVTLARCSSDSGYEHASSPPTAAGPSMDKVTRLLDNWTEIDEDSKLQEDQYQL
eukprot:scaffold34461_cov45-Prasinocladus_malaysianus.AAC.1